MLVNTQNNTDIAKRRLLRDFAKLLYANYGAPSTVIPNFRRGSLKTIANVRLLPKSKQKIAQNRQLAQKAL